VPNRAVDALTNAIDTVADGADSISSNGTDGLNGTGDSRGNGVVDGAHYPGRCHVGVCLVFLWEVLELRWSSLGRVGSDRVSVRGFNLLDSGAELGRSLLCGRGLLLVQSVPLCVDLRTRLWSRRRLGSR